MVTRTVELLGRSDLAQTWAAISTRESHTEERISVLSEVPQMVRMLVRMRGW